MLVEFPEKFLAAYSILIADAACCIEFIQMTELGVNI
jgi:hypothetical protein